MRSPRVLVDDVRDALDDEDIVEIWVEDSDEYLATLELLVPTEDAESVVSVLEERFGRTKDFRLILMSVEASIPLVDREDVKSDQNEDAADKGTPGDDGESEDKDKDETPPINIEELYSDVTTGVEISSTFVLLTALSSIVATVGLTRNDVAIVIAAMIITPLLNPNMSLSLASTLGDLKLAFRSLRVNFVGFLVAFGVSGIFGLLVDFNPANQQIADRTRLGLLEILLAASAGTAGALSFTTRQTGQVVGVMVAVALLPPAVAAGMLLGGGYWSAALGALYLTAVNLICLNLAGVMTFFAQNIRPRTAWESVKARRSRWTAIAIWTVALAALALMLLYGGEYRRYP